MTQHTFAVGDKVHHSREFLRSIGWVTDVPEYGFVRAVNGPLVTVQWLGNPYTVKVFHRNLRPFAVRHLELY